MNVQVQPHATTTQRHLPFDVWPVRRRRDRRIPIEHLERDRARVADDLRADPNRHWAVAHRSMNRNVCSGR